MHIDRGVPIWGDAGGVQTYYKSVYQALVLDESKCGSFKF